ncbi:sugar phosphate isomerase/epimerase [Dyadobacter sp. CY356]|uniref:sugar phosphate isomerase/epimerase family protein n=1 Tax=Dyadobacter sp. CY356 TaxID=2906442 RepID=UPI001F3941C2|nr:sugar phosphate isomerase/epimerase [Dyadobacter sp. CY356]MCF0055758.1 sugar phosphate isomerase/epimerase [Dyadobacter sp. CY356]
MQFLKSTLLFCLLAVCGLSASAQNNPEDKSGWKLGSQSYTFRLFTFAEALKKIDSCGLKYVEAFPGQKLGGGVDGTMDFKMDAAKRQEVKALLKKYGITMTAFGVVNATNEEEWKTLFEFAKDMGILNIDTEPKPEQFAYIAPLADKYKINVALHNHPKPSHYWSPDSVLKYAAKSKFIGSCSDIGHWVRSGLDPVACLKQLNGHVLGLHFKDVVKDTPDGKYHDVVWGKGDSQVDAVIAELKRQKFKGPISVEYEYHWENNGPEVAESVKYFRTTFQKVK